MERIRVLLVDESAAARRVLSQMIEAQSNMEVVGMAADSMMAQMMIKSKKPDVLSLAVEMRNVNGMTFLDEIMQMQPMPVVMVSCHTQERSEMAMLALKLGAVGVLGKPSKDLSDDVEGFSKQFIQKIEVAGRVHAKATHSKGLKSKSIEKTHISPELKSSSNQQADAVQKTDQKHSPLTHQITALGASTGGTQAIKQVLEVLPADFPAVLVVLHLPVSFTSTFVKMLNDASAMTVQVAVDGDMIRCGSVYVSPGDQHLRVEKVGDYYVCRVKGSDLVKGHCPSVDVLFDSVATSAKSNAVGVLMTGMGIDGVQGLASMKELGAWTIAQDEESSVVWGMPGEAVAQGAVQQQLHLDQIGLTLQKLVR